MNRLDALEARMAAIDTLVSARPPIVFHGGWNDSLRYAAGSVVQRAGALYIAETDVPVGVMPHDAEQDEGTRSPWKLACRRGREGRPGSIPPGIEQRLKRLEQLS